VQPVIQLTAVIPVQVEIELACVTPAKAGVQFVLLIVI
jgi:hypothetical protein